MQKLWHTRPAPPGDETEHAVRHWSALWEKSPLPSPKAVAALRRREEYRIMRPFLENLPGKRIMDAGCGMGEWTLFLVDQGFETVGLDLSRETIARLCERHPRVRFIQGDVRATGLEAESCDAILSWGVFEHFEDGPGACLDEAWRVLRPGGKLFLTVPFHNVRHLLRALRWRGREKAIPGRARAFYQWRLTPAELADALEQAGFDVLLMRPIHLQEGLRRLLSVDLGLRNGLLLDICSYGLAKGLSLLIPRGLACHMLMAVAGKPERELA